MQFVMFSKMLQPYSVDRAEDVIKQLGFDGVDLTVRPGGHVLPEKVTQDLPEAIETLEAKGLKVPMITTGIVSADEAHAEDIFRMAAECGVPKLKLGYWQYKGFGHIKEQMAEVRAALKGIAALALKYGVQAGVHIHSGRYMSADGAVLHMLLEGIDPRAVGAYIDPGHMTSEGGNAGWEICMDILSDRIIMVAAKAMGWFRYEEDGKVIWRDKMVPLEEGMVRWPQVFRNLKAIGFTGPLSVHSEYQGGHSWRDLTLEELIEQTRKDLAYLKRVEGEVT